MFKPFRIDSQGFYELIIFPVFADLTPAGFPNAGNMNEWTLMDGVSSSRPVVDIRQTQNILRRRDASCEIIYSKLATASIRKISTEEVYAATQWCRNEFYVGCLKDWRNNDPAFGKNILPFFLKAVNADLASNAYFGDITRNTSATALNSTGVYDGIFRWIKKYIADGTIPGAQTKAITDGTDFTVTPASAYNLLASMFNSRSVLMRSMPKREQAFYVSYEIAQGYEDYLISIGLNANGQSLVIDGIDRLAFKGIPIYVMDTWTPIISEIKGGAGYAAILTLRGNFIFATDSKYGEGPNGTTALEVWYDTEKMMWFYRYFMKAGTQIAMPEHMVVALSSWN